MNIEEWKEVIGYEDLYQVSNLGRVRRLDSIVNGAGERTYFKPGRILAPSYIGRYAKVNLSNRKKHGKLVHRLVAEAFLPNPENKPTVNHIDANPANNKVDNLEWCTHLENATHAYNLNLIPLGPDRSNSKLTQDQVREIRGSQRRICDLCKEYSVTARVIIGVKSGKTYKSII